MGPQFKDVVKVEGKWRLDLYKQWLKDPIPQFMLPPKTKEGKTSPRYEQWNQNNPYFNKPQKPTGWKTIYSPSDPPKPSERYKNILAGKRKNWYGNE